MGNGIRFKVDAKKERYYIILWDCDDCRIVQYWTNRTEKENKRTLYLGYICKKTHIPCKGLDISYALKNPNQYKMNGKRKNNIDE